MKRKNLLFIIILFLQSTLFAQIEYYDAIELSELIKGNSDHLPMLKTSCAADPRKKHCRNSNRVFEILSSYKTVKATSYREIMEGFQKNPFFSDYLKKDSIKTVASGQKILNEQFSLKGVAGLDVTNLARGTAQFLIERANEEINILFFDKFKEFLKENKEASTLFPKSTLFITNTQPHQYPILLQSFKEAFKKDIDNIVSQLDDLIKLPRYVEFGEKNPEAYAGLAALASSGILLEGGTVPDAIKTLGSFSFKNLSNSETKNLYASIKLMSALSESIRSKEEGKAWINVITFKNKIIDDPVALKIYFGLIYQKVEDIEFNIDGSDKSVQSLLKEVKDNIDILKNILGYFQKFESGWSEISSSIKNINSLRDKGELVPYTLYYNYVNNNLDLIQRLLFVDELLNQINPNEVEINYSDKIKEYISLLRTGNEIFKDLNERNYSSAIVNLILVCQNTIGQSEIRKFSPTKDEMKKYLDAKGISKPKVPTDRKYKELILSEYGIVTNDVKEDFENLKDSKELGIGNSDFLKYTSFMAAMIEADSPEAAKNLIKAAALPAGSFTIKKNSKFNISVQSYLGVFSNFNPDNNISNSWNNKWGVTAPIGVSFNWGLGNAKGKSSLGFMVSLLDIGAVVDYEIRTDTVTTITDQGGQTTTTKEISNSTPDFKIELGQIFSPGGYLVWSLPGRLPFTLGLGLQYGPGLTEINTSSGTPNPIIGNPDLRVNAFLGFDIPLFTVFNKNK